MTRMLDGRYRLAELKHVDLASAQEIRAKYAGLHLDLADAVGDRVGGSVPDQSRVPAATAAAPGPDIAGERPAYPLR
jgi:hypothetical protein